MVHTSCSDLMYDADELAQRKRVDETQPKQPSDQLNVTFMYSFNSFKNAHSTSYHTRKMLSYGITAHCLC